MRVYVYVDVVYNFKGIWSSFFTNLSSWKKDDTITIFLLCNNLLQNYLVFLLMLFGTKWRLYHSITPRVSTLSYAPHADRVKFNEISCLVKRKRVKPSSWSCKLIRWERNTVYAWFVVVFDYLTLEMLSYKFNKSAPR